jgi:hypothetical protein
MFSLIVVLLIGLAAALVFFSSPEQSATSKNTRDEPDDGEWEYGDIWKQGSPDEPVPEDDVRYVEILRGDTGMGYSDTTMQDFILYLGSWGIRAAYNSYPLEQINIYVLKVEAGKLDEAREYLKEKFKVQGSKFKT